MSALNHFAANKDFAKRKTTEKEHIFRSPFERDRDRILYSKEFRRLNRKTQIFVAGFDDHIRNRLTHTLEVAQLSQTIASSLELDMALTTAIAYGHDVGHTPFGHVGERTLNYFMNGCGNYRDFNSIHKDFRGFKHNWQSVRVLTELEKISNDYDGLNLTSFTLWGILNHTGIKPKECDFKSKDNKCNIRHQNNDCKISSEGLLLTFYNKYENWLKTSDGWTFEGLVVRIADEIAQRHHDIEDGLLTGIINRDEILEVFLSLSDFLTEEDLLKLSQLPIERNMGVFIKTASSLLINILVINVINHAKEVMQQLESKYKIKNSLSFHYRKKEISTNEDIFTFLNYDDSMAKNEGELQKFLKNRILNSQIAQSMDGKSTFILTKIINVYLDNPQQLPDQTIYTLYMSYLSKKEKKKLIGNEYEYNVGYFRERLMNDHSKLNTFKYRNILMRTICDFIAGMTDDFALKQYDKLYSTQNVFIKH